MTRRFNLQCNLNGIEAGKLLKLLGILDGTISHASECPDGQAFVFMDKDEYAQLKETVGMFSQKLGGFGSDDQ